MDPDPISLSGKSLMAQRRRKYDVKTIQAPANDDTVKQMIRIMTVQDSKEQLQTAKNDRGNKYEKGLQCGFKHKECHCKEKCQTPNIREWMY